MDSNLWMVRPLTIKDLVERRQHSRHGLRCHHWLFFTSSTVHSDSLLRRAWVARLRSSRSSPFSSIAGSPSTSSRFLEVSPNTSSECVRQQCFQSCGRSEHKGLNHKQGVYVLEGKCFANLAQTQTLGEMAATLVATNAVARQLLAVGEAV